MRAGLEKTRLTEKCIFAIEKILIEISINTIFPSTNVEPIFRFGVRLSRPWRTNGLNLPSIQKKIGDEDEKMDHSCLIDD